MKKALRVYIVNEPNYTTIMLIMFMDSSSTRAWIVLKYADTTTCSRLKLKKKKKKEETLSSTQYDLCKTQYIQQKK